MGHNARVNRVSDGQMVAVRLQPTGSLRRVSDARKVHLARRVGSSVTNVTQIFSGCLFRAPRCTANFARSLRDLRSPTLRLSPGRGYATPIPVCGKGNSEGKSRLFAHGWIGIAQRGFERGDCDLDLISALPKKAERLRADCPDQKMWIREALFQAGNHLRSNGQQQLTGAPFIKSGIPGARQKLAAKRGQLLPDRTIAAPTPKRRVFTLELFKNRLSCWRTDVIKHTRSVFET